ncbi:MAG TPA: hypothetical protein VLR26_02480 [Frankiaceae bacterium]|nr:hypothetical protein [Frankiaceae bacterium]
MDTGPKGLAEEPPKSDDEHDWTLSNPADLGIWAPPPASHCVRCGTRPKGDENQCLVCNYDLRPRNQVQEAAVAAFDDHGQPIWGEQPGPLPEARAPAMPSPFEPPYQPPRGKPSEPKKSRLPTVLASLAVILLLALVGIGVLLVRHFDSRSTPAVVVSPPVRLTPTPVSGTASAPTTSTPPASPPTSTAPARSTGTTSGLATLSEKPHICADDGGSLGCSYRFKLEGEDLIHATPNDDVYNRLALVGPAFVDDPAGSHFLVVTVRVTTFNGSVSVNPSEFALTTSVGSDPATTASVPEISNQVRSPISVHKGTDFIGTLAFPDQSRSGTHIDWLRKTGQPAATWTLAP